MLSLNICENYFSMLVKHTEGKRISTDINENWIVLQHFVAGLRRNANYCKVLGAKCGAHENKIRNENNENSNKRKDYLKKYAKLSKSKHRLSRNHLMGKYETSNCNHKSEQLKMKDCADVNQITKKRKPN